MTAPKNGQPRRRPTVGENTQARPILHPLCLEIAVQVTGIVVRDGRAEKVQSPVVTVLAAEWAQWSAGLIQGFEAQVLAEPPVAT